MEKPTATGTVNNQILNCVAFWFCCTQSLVLLLNVIKIEFVGKYFVDNEQWQMDLLFLIMIEDNERWRI